MIEQSLDAISGGVYTKYTLDIVKCGYRVYEGITEEENREWLKAKLENDGMSIYYIKLLYETSDTEFERLFPQYANDYMSKMVSRQYEVLCTKLLPEHKAVVEAMWKAVPEEVKEKTYTLCKLEETRKMSNGYR